MAIERTFLIMRQPMLACVLAVACGHAEPHTAKKTPALHVEIAGSLASDTQTYRADIDAAIDHVIAWYTEHGLAVRRDDLIDHAVVFADVADARQGLATRLGVPAAQIPDGFSGTVVDRTLYVVGRDAYRATFTRLYPAQPWSLAEYRMLIAHEVTHRAHAVHATRLFGSEDGMGPSWFFEGLALVSAGQLAQPGTPDLTLTELRELIAKDATTPLGYVAYARMVRSLASRFSIRWLVERAGRSDFMAQVAQGWH